MPLMAPDLTRATYARVLECMYPLLSAWEVWAAEHAPADLADLVAARRRSPMMRDDLLTLNAPLPEVHAFDAAKIPGLPSRAAFLGAMYVIEGSALGGQYIAAHVGPLLQLTPGAGCSYFAGYGAETGSKWNEFKAVVAAVDDRDSVGVIAAAKAMFAVFEAAILPVSATLSA